MVNKMEAENRAGKQMLALKDDLFFSGGCLLSTRCFVMRLWIQKVGKSQISEAPITTKVNNEKALVVGNYNKPL